MLVQSENSKQTFASPFQKIDIEKLVKTKLPPSPGGILRIKQLLGDDNVSAQTIAQAMSLEPTLVARIMRLANSSIYSFEREIVSISHAVNVIGTKFLYDIVIMEMASSAFSTQLGKSQFAKKVWEHSIAVAMLAREISRFSKIGDPEMAFTCGLLHDIGKLILLIHDRENYTQIQEFPGESEILAGERTQYGYTHAEVGSLVARRWGLPDDICYSILNHHNPSRSDQAIMISHILNVSDSIANIHNWGTRIEDESVLLFSESVIILDLTEDSIREIWTKVTQDISELVRTYS